ncbi:dipeptidase [Salipaludibacillus sp. LMS25]|jgi:membrane dipeptidase|uniref:dipeptidase n=1 Tax=Salipaludibacillus sp. LMS25 TaxID=2924031 RepID=UPI0020D044B1|nr:dipeptidase [Salipaludibacillus sp. LMS25]UTR14707.1 dipeptidase [Salipaludibacillus sp. LMS25]
MKVFDLHCDALLKLYTGHAVDFTSDEALDVTKTNLSDGHVALQVFAVFVDPHIPSDEKYRTALQQIDYFHSEVVGKHETIKKITKWQDIKSLAPTDIGAMLSLEGADAFGNDLMKLRTFYELGVKSIGLTWNNANLCADGCGEPRGAGLTQLGAEVVKLNNKNKVWTDLSHLSIRSFWDTVALADYPIATHSNSYTVYPHRRNLNDKQAEEIFRKNGLIGMVFNPPFVRNNDSVQMTDLIRHIDYFCSIGGVDHLAFGSDFDGIATYIHGLEHAGKYQALINELLNYFTEKEVRGFAYQNMLNHLPEDK